MKESEINDDINKDIIAKGYDHSIFTKDYKCPISWGIEELMGTSLLAAVIVAVSTRVVVSAVNSITGIVRRKRLVRDYDNCLIKKSYNKSYHVT